MKKYTKIDELIEELIEANINDDMERYDYIENRIYRLLLEEVVDDQDTGISRKINKVLNIIC